MGLGLAECEKLLSGPLGSSVLFKGRNAEKRTVYEVKLVREALRKAPEAEPQTQSLVELCDEGCRGIVTLLDKIKELESKLSISAHDLAEAKAAHEEMEMLEAEMLGSEAGGAGEEGARNLARRGVVVDSVRRIEEEMSGGSPNR